MDETKKVIRLVIKGEGELFEKEGWYFYHAAQKMSLNPRVKYFSIF